MTVVRAAGLLLWWTPSIAVGLARRSIFSAGYAYRVARAHRLMDAGDVNEAERVIARLRRELEAMRPRKRGVAV